MSSPEIILSTSAAQDSSSASGAIPIPSKPANSWGDIDFSMATTGMYTPSYVGSFGSAQESVLSNWGNTEDHSSLNPLSSDMDMQDPTARLFDNLNGDEDYVPDYDVDHASTSPFHMLEQDFNSLSGPTDLSFSEDMSQVKSAIPANSGMYAGDLFSNPQDMGLPQIYPKVSHSSTSLNDLHQDRELNNRSRASSSASSYREHPSPSFGMAHDFSTSNQINEQLGRLTFDHPSYPSLNTSTPDISQSTPSPPGATSPQVQPPISPPHLVIPGDSSAASVPPIMSGNLPPFGPPQTMGPGGPSIEILPATPVNTSDAATRNTLHFVLQNAASRSGGAAVNDSRGRQPFSGSNTFQMSSRAGNGSRDPSTDPAATEEAVWNSVTAFHQQTKNTAMGSGASAVGQTPTTLPHPTSYHHGYNIPALPTFSPPETTTSKTQQAGSEPAPINLPTLPPFNHTQSAPQAGSTDPQLFNSIIYSRPELGQPQASPSAPEFLLPSSGHSRSRSFSDTSSRPSPSFWDPSNLAPNMNAPDFGSRPSTSSSIHSPHFMMNAPSLNMPDVNSMDMSMDALFLPSSNTPSRSNSLRGQHKRGAKSEDLTPLRSPASMSSTLLPDTEYVRPIKIDGSLAPFDPRVAGESSLGGGFYMSGGMTGPTRRRGSSSGHDRTGSVTSLRTTPYPRPSPHASPAPSPHHSPNLPGQALPGVADIHSGQQQNQAMQPIMKVERPLVTTPATKTASANRRRAEASFVCPVPGCGSTFTRHFNLRGHLRSHNEERPFKCKWPGCEKGFARQHDCKRHEALHLNIRPYTCEGCQKTFARMDALNRHLRSEGGIDCQKHHKLDGLTSFGTDDPLPTKQEPEWSEKRGGIMM